MSNLREKIVKELTPLINNCEYCIDDGQVSNCPKCMLRYQIADRILALLPKVPLFQRGDFVLHSGGNTEWRINAEKLDEASIATLASMIAERTGPFSSVQGVHALAPATRAANSKE